MYVTNRHCGYIFQGITPSDSRGGACGKRDKIGTLLGFTENEPASLHYP